MAKPSGATLTRLFAVSDAERKAFWHELEARKGKREPTQPEATTGVPVTGTPAPRIPEQDTDKAFGLQAQQFAPGIPVTGVPFSHALAEPAVAVSGAPASGIPEAGAPFVLSAPAPSRKIREAVKVQDGHSLGEQAVYAALWAAGQPHGEDCRRLTIGYRTLSDACGLTVNNCKANLQALVRKLAIEPIAGHTSTLGTTYLIHSYPAILRRRRQAGMTHVIKTKGVIFVNRETGAPASGIPVRPLGVLEPGTPHGALGTPEPDILGIPVSATPIRNKEAVEKKQHEEDPSSSSFPLVVAAAREQGVTLDDDAVRRIVLRCQTFDDSATEAEVAHFVQTKTTQLRNSRTIGNLVGLLIKAVPQYFIPPATELSTIRERLAQEAERDAQRSMEAAAGAKEAARAILADTEASEPEREWARALLGEGPAP